ncbi:hypothetical protein HTZ77_13550 [Nonomuraea sp. SMC257]|uniref:Uncharacterized protein n=1 Tax=Nonomuraea montanisoli TaxID=2741721 RepID=A0A7Y6M2R9_9ACTN|nr:hypothetical protein [Nonomuraea montanisoli]NUW32447.1 hypothetical protein [Nonomuraea montanisoli]
MDMLNPGFPTPLPQFSTSCERQVKTASPACQLHRVNGPVYGVRGFVELVLANQGQAEVAKAEWAADALARGVDVQWGEWLQGGRFVSLGLICCCPNRHVMHRCPTGAS